MAARRLVIVLLILLGLSTLAAALLPQHSIRRDGSTATGTSATQTVPATATSESTGKLLAAEITIGGGKTVVVACPTGKARKPDCPVIRVGDQLSLVVKSEVAKEIEIPHFGLVAVTAPDAPANFNVVLDEAKPFGILYASDHRVAAQVEVLPAKTTPSD